ncbi:hypothetical protein [Pseudonocardia sp.]|uniref:hypothetical protein n=1 Tax=Pseudonocardia sp. TaxID=60912 RepID=UPI003D0FE749
MLNGVGAEAAHGTVDADDMGVFVDRIAAAGSDRPTALAAAQVRRRIEAGAVPAGVRRLAESLAATVTDPPAQRWPVDEPESLVDAVQVRNLVVLEHHAAPEVAAAVTALLTAGRRVLVTAPDSAGLDAVRARLPESVTDRIVSRLPAMPPAELRELRKLLVTDTAARQARPGQRLPDESALPPLEQVAPLCERVRSLTGDPGSHVIAHLLDDVDTERMEAIVEVARCVQERFAALGPREAGGWTWNVLDDLVVQRNRATFDRLREEAAQAVTTATRIEGAPPVAFVEPLTDEGRQVLFSYFEFLRDGGRPRSFFRPPEQRDAQPVLAQIRVAGEVPESESELRLILSHRELADRLERIVANCGELGVPAPRDVSLLPALLEELDKIAAAARSMATLRHDVLFLRPDSPIRPPDADQADRVAAEILAFADRTPGVEAERELDELADRLAELAPPETTAPEHTQAVAALRERDPHAYAEALNALGAARREHRDGERQAALVARLRATAPTLADAWTQPGAVTAGLGAACLVPMDALLAQLPPADSADVVLVLGAAGLGVERLLLTAAAPRLVAVLAPNDQAAPAPSLLSVLRRAGALVIRGGVGDAGGEVVPLARAVPTPREAQVG